jgi:hypothetical protein
MRTTLTSAVLLGLAVTQEASRTIMGDYLRRTELAMAGKS